MSLVALRVELPAYAHSFIIQVPDSCTILDVKQEIFRTCIGGPRIEGQRIIWRGRNLIDDERVGALWKSLDEPRIVHLAVHPSSWSSSPPETLRAPTTPAALPRSESVVRPVDTDNHPTPPIAPVAPSPLAYILYKHQNALFTLTHDSTTHLDGNEDLETTRAWAMHVVNSNGWSWPAILDADFPPATAGGLKYERVVVDGQSYLTLLNPDATPTTLQAHALKVLTYTFTLLSLPAPHPTITRVTPSQTVPLPPNVNALLQQLGLAQLRVAPNHNQNIPNPNGLLPELREVQLRPLLAPLLMLVFRTLLLLYFVAPARKPIFGILILAWMLYEIWQPIRNGFLRGWRRGWHPAVGDDQRRQNAPENQDQNADQNAQAGPIPNGAGGLAAARMDNQAGVLLDNMANINIQNEEQIINQAPGTVVDKPNLGHRVMTFFSLLITTVHPAVWNRRRAALRQREGRIRTEANAMVRPESEGADGAGSESRAQFRADLLAQQVRRPRWVEEYRQRVVAGDWVDDSD